VIADDAVDDRKAEPGSLTDVFRGEERLEDALARLFILF